MSPTVTPLPVTGNPVTPISVTQAAVTLQCAWCRKIMRPGDPAHVSHGICVTCKAQVLADYRKEATHG